MKRAVISLDEKDKAWLEDAARREGRAAAELVRRAVRLLRERESLEGQPFSELLQRTSGIWRSGEGLAYQDRLRDEW
jgi:hypothetical protein